MLLFARKMHGLLPRRKTIYAFYLIELHPACGGAGSRDVSVIKFTKRKGSRDAAPFFGVNRFGLLCFCGD